MGIPGRFNGGYLGVDPPPPAQARHTRYILAGLDFKSKASFAPARSLPWRCARIEGNQWHVPIKSEITLGDVSKHTVLMALPI